MADELWTTGPEASARLEQLASMWTELANVALGRSVQSVVSDALAAELVSEQAAFRSWRAELGGWTLASTIVDDLAEYTRRYNAMRARVAAELGKLPSTARPVLPAPATVWRETAPAAAGTIASVFAGASGLALGVGLLFLLSRRKAAK
jgi:hypothetical protein